ncbi:MAG: hypothetical protein A2534_02870 [Candidatus Magasanikbacteria bacterium RIFOXYD2_FULL_39_9]|uniref:Gcp-like domain-containing protein n=1 Tax=Candidatus Magasanikbacteria bacterium RIFOXYD1_FULL_40_23 TaxID=1798705 RepID=A0A1F6P7G8_9BACT|nr:MAG: hypothetical protein A2563_00845 [Candidatus Magasanikbacteria bacterium RIFOXYD1_FULL_40_23]OGH92194.1 MAG: hypothetical protein A2534_02870 [Candidatus Magasanikbacteria bacterium RIFOXYD2_FULL_39_9]
MLLIIDNTEDDKTVLSFWLNKKFVQQTFKKIPSSRNNDSLLICLDKFLSKLKISLKDIKCLGVVVGSGRFTSTRLAVTMANTLAYGLHIPVIKLLKNFDQNLALEAARESVAGKYIMPEYSAEAHIQNKN